MHVRLTDNMSLYREAAKVLKNVLQKRGSLRNLVFSSSIENKKALFAVVCETLKYDRFLKDVASGTGLVNLERGLHGDEALAIILLYEHILGRGVTGQYKSCLQKHKSAIHSCCELLKVKARVANVKDLKNKDRTNTDILLPRYVRVNTLKTSLEAVSEELHRQGWTQVTTDIRSMISSTGVYSLDPDIPSLLVFPPNTDFHDNPLYKSGEIILQDKASCFPAFLLSPATGSHVIDCCAAPGNKTSHLASILGNKGRIHAFDKDQGRLSTLRTMMDKAGASCVSARCQDFLTVDPSDPAFEDVLYILVDPSCSGSGLVNRMGGEKEEITPERLTLLSRFQISILSHALGFPSVQRVVYSTCSVKEEENEQVVEEVYQHVRDQFSVATLMPSWRERGLESYPHGSACIRMSPDKACTNGFFVSCFERLTGQTENGDIQESKACTTKTSTCNTKTSTCNTKTSTCNGHQQKPDAQLGDSPCPARNFNKVKRKRKRKCVDGSRETLERPGILTGFQTDGAGTRTRSRGVTLGRDTMKKATQAQVLAGETATTCTSSGRLEGSSQSSDRETKRVKREHRFPRSEVIDARPNSTAGKWEVTCMNSEDLETECGKSDSKMDTHTETKKKRKRKKSKRQPTAITVLTGQILEGDGGVIGDKSWVVGALGQSSDRQQVLATEARDSIRGKRKQKKKRENQ